MYASDQHLPDDLGRWPHDPYRILGVGRDVDLREVRRAYIRLVRKFKPEHAPDHFQRIREAFEQIQRQIEARAMYDESFEEDWPEAVSGGGWAEPQATHGESSRESDSAIFDQAASSQWSSDEKDKPHSRFASDPDEQCAAAWSIARSGRPSEAYARLLALRDRRESISEVCVRLYWLLTAVPDLDTERTPCDWLVEALQATRVSGPPLELYRNEILNDRNEILSQRCDRLLDCDAVPGATADLLDFRWRALSYLRRWDRIVADLPRVRDKTAYDDEKTWGRLLLFAMDQLAWFTDAPEAKEAFDACHREIEGLSHLHASLDNELDKMDLLLELVDGWRRLRRAVNIPKAWNDLVPLSWTQTFDVVRPHLMPMLKRIAEKPIEALEIFDRIAAQSTAVIAQMGSLIQNSRCYNFSYNEDNRDWDEIERSAQQFLLLHGKRYRSVRKPLLEFCLREAIDPEQMGGIAYELNERSQASGASWADAIRDDGPIRFVYAAYRSFWG